MIILLLPSYFFVYERVDFISNLQKIMYLIFHLNTSNFFPKLFTTTSQNFLHSNHRIETSENYNFASSLRYAALRFAPTKLAKLSSISLECTKEKLSIFNNFGRYIIIIQSEIAFSQNRTDN